MRADVIAPHRPGGVAPHKIPGFNYKKIKELDRVGYICDGLYLTRQDMLDLSGHTALEWIGGIKRVIRCNSHYNICRRLVRRHPDKVFFDLKKGRGYAMVNGDRKVLRDPSLLIDPVEYRGRFLIAYEIR